MPLEWVLTMAWVHIACVLLAWVLCLMGTANIFIYMDYGYPWYHMSNHGMGTYGMGTRPRRSSLTRPIMGNVTPHTVGGIAQIRNFVRNLKIHIAKSTIQPKLSKIKNH